MQKWETISEKETKANRPAAGSSVEHLPTSARPEFISSATKKRKNGENQWKQ
jgi:hypothetical protein